MKVTSITVSANMRLNSNYSHTERCVSMTADTEGGNPENVHKELTELVNDMLMNDMNQAVKSLNDLQ